MFVYFFDSKKGFARAWSGGYQMQHYEDRPTKSFIVKINVAADKADKEIERYLSKPASAKRLRKVDGSCDSCCPTELMNKFIYCSIFEYENIAKPAPPKTLNKKDDANAASKVIISCGIFYFLAAPTMMKAPVK